MHRPCHSYDCRRGSLTVLFLAMLVGSLGRAAVAQVAGDHDPGFVVAPGDVDGDGHADLLIRTRNAWHGWFGMAQPPFFRRGGTSTDIRAMPTGAPVAQVGGLVFEPSIEGSTRPGVGRRIEVRCLRPLAGAAAVEVVDVVAVEASGPERSVTAPNLLPLPERDRVLLVWSEVSLTAPALLRAAVLGVDRVSVEVTVALGGGTPPAGSGWRAVGLRLVDADSLLGLPGVTAQVLLAGDAGDLAALALQVTGTASGVPEPVGWREWRGTPPLVPEEFRRTQCGVVAGRMAPAPRFGDLAVVCWGGWLLGIPGGFRPPYAELPGEAVRVPDSTRFLFGAAADYDGDGADEVVALVRGPAWRHDLLAVLDPLPQVLDGQVIQITPGRPAWFGGHHAYAVRHGAPADIDGDGHVDLAMVTVGAQPGRCRLALLRSEPDPVRGGRRLRPYW